MLDTSGWEKDTIFNKLFSFYPTVAGSKWESTQEKLPNTIGGGIAIRGP
jgi:hypothetical protein